ncbi:MAG TPA: DNA/RNA non-specific endonuclease [Microcoleaceae cyanobacterium]
MVKRGWLGLVVVLVLVVGCTILKAPTGTSIHLMLGNPSNAILSTGAPDNYLMDKPQYALSYNSQKGIPNWVSWQLNRDWLGTVPRRNDFRPDFTLPEDWYRVTPADYINTGFDRGHMTPSADRTATPIDNSSTFLMTNIMPQTPDNNQGPWEELESYCRELAKQGKELYIVAGGYGQKKLIAGDRIEVPAHTWKIVVVLDRPGQGVDAIMDATRVIAIDIPNKQGIRERNWRSFRVSVDQLEAATGYDFLSKVPEGVQRSLESRVDQG